jgi:hypothetical protein
MLLSLAVLLIVGFIINHSFSFVISDPWFTSGLLLLVLLSLIDQPFFSKDSNIFVNAVTAGLSLLLISKDQRTITFWCFFGLTLYLIVCSYVLMWLRKYELSQENKIIQFLTRINRQLGKPETLFSAFFLWGAVKQYGLNSNQFNALLWYWIIFMILNLPSVSKTLENIFTSKKADDTTNIVGRIFGVQSKNTFLVKLSANRKRTLKRFDCVEFLYSIDRHEHKGIVLDVYWLDQEQWIKVLTTAEIDGLFEKTVSKYEPDCVYKTDTSVESDFLKSFIGLVYDNSNIERIRFSYNAKIEVMNGQLVELTVNNHKVLYQIVQGITKNELLENKNETGFIIGEAIQLGEWNIEKGRFERFGWVPSINTPLFIASCIPEQSIENNEYIIGNIPNTNYPVILNKELAVTHHTAVLGITGSGKSVFTRNLIKQIANDQTRIIIVDLTGEYKDRMPNLVSVVDEEDAKVIVPCIDALVAENSKYPNQRNDKIISENERKVKITFASAIKGFLEGTDHMGVFELTEITNNASNLEYTRWFFWVLFKIAKDCGNFGKRVCVVLEEAHTIIPETTSMGVSDNASKATVNSIAQIALQGRKYNIGFIVIAQRTANVSKTILTQCNSVIVFQEIDKTTSDFLSNYLGQSFVDILPTLKSRTAIAMGKAFRSNAPMIFEVPEISEAKVLPKNSKDDGKIISEG